MDEKRMMLRQYLGALAYRTQKALRDAPPGFENYRVSPGVRTTWELLLHMTGVIGYARTHFTGGSWDPALQSGFPEEIERFHALLQDLDKYLVGGHNLIDTTEERLLQGPFSDAMSHTGQLAILRRLFGSPVPPENFIVADITPDNLGEAQLPPVSPDADWHDAEGRREQQ